MDNLAFIVFKQIFLELLDGVTVEYVNALDLYKSMDRLSKEKIKEIIFGLSDDNLVDIPDKNEFNYRIKINLRGKEFLQKGGYPKNYRELEFQIAEAKAKAVKDMSSDAGVISPIQKLKAFRLSKIPVLKPLFRYRKYEIAGKLLKIAVSNSAVAIYLVDDNLKEHKMHQKMQMPYPLSNFLEGNPKLEPERVLEAVDILAESNHIEKVDDDDIYKITITATKAGERAYNDGYYTEKKWRSIWKIVAAIAGIIGVAIPTIKWLIPLLLKYLNQPK